MPSLPNAVEATVEARKLSEYLMSADHPIGKSKAAFFSQFGFVRADLEALEKALCDHAMTQPVVEVKSSYHGTKYVVECACQTPDGRNPCINSVWITEPNNQAPRLVTAYPAKRR